MPKIIINEIEKNFNIGSAGNLGDLYKKLLAEFKDQDSIVYKILLNGQVLNEEELHNRGDLPVKDIGSLELVILTLKELALNNINNAMEYINKLIPGINKASELFRTQNAIEANKFYIQCIEGLTWLQEVIENVLPILRKELEQLDFGSQVIKKHQNQLLPLIKKIKDSQSREDWVMLADLLEYELSPYLDEWKSIFPLLVCAAKK